jgi:small subunit ribosomal protein S35
LQRRDAYKKMETWAPAEDEQHQKLIGRIRDLAENMDGKDELQELASDYGDNEDDFTDFLKGQGVEEPDVLGALRNKKKLKQTFLNMGDPEPFEDDDFEMEADTHMEMSTLAHGELEHHREMRHYARLAAWEMPLLSSMLLPRISV